MKMKCIAIGQNFWATIIQAKQRAGVIILAIVDGAGLTVTYSILKDRKWNFALPTVNMIISVQLVKPCLSIYWSLLIPKSTRLNFMSESINHLSFIHHYVRWNNNDFHNHNISIPTYLGLFYLVQFHICNGPSINLLLNILIVYKRTSTGVIDLF